MAVLVQALNVIVRNEVLEDLYPGGVEGYRNDCPNKTFCTDGHVTSIQFMAPNDVNTFVSRLSNHGLLYMHLGKIRDIAVIDVPKGLVHPCDWLNLDTNNEGVMFCWLSSHSPGEIAVPEGWTRGMPLPRIDPKEMEENFRYVKTENNLDVYEDRRTGKLVYIGRPFIGRDIEIRRERLADIGMRIYKLGEEAEKARMKKKWKIGSKLESELQYLCETARQLKEEEGPLEQMSRHFYGLALRILEKWVEAENEFRILVSSYPDEINGWLELTWCLSEQEKFEEAEQAAYRGIHVAPGSAAAWGNYVLSLMRMNRKDEARAAIEKALVLDPDDQKNRLMFENFDSFF